MPTTKNTSCCPASAAPFQPLLRAAGALGVLLIGAGLLTHSAQTAEGIRDGLASCATLVIPSLLPFLIFSGMLSTTRLGNGSPVPWNRSAGGSFTCRPKPAALC